MKQHNSADLVGQFLIRVIVLCALVGGFLLWASGAFAARPTPGEWSLRGLASWSQPLVASGTALPAVGSHSAGDLFVLNDGVASPTLYWLDPSNAWQLLASPATGTTGGVGTHSLLTQLDYASSGHTGFLSTIASGTTLPATETYAVGDLFVLYVAASSTTTLYRLNADETWAPFWGVGVASISYTEPNHALLSNLAYDDSGHTGFEREGAATAVWDLAQAAIASVTGGVATHADLAGLDFDSSGHTGFERAGAASAAAAAIAGDVVLGFVPMGLTEQVGETWTTATDTAATVIPCFASARNGIVIAGSNNGSIFRSVDSGQTWAIASTSGETTYSMAYLGDGVFLAGTGASGFIFRSTDYGVTWTLASDTPAGNIYGLANCGQGRIVAVSGTTGLIFRSVDGGVTWTTATDTADTYIESVDYCGSGVVVAGGGTTGNIFRSTDYGATWAIASDTPADYIAAIKFVGASTVIAGGDNSKTIYRSTDSGASWVTQFVASGAVTAFAVLGNGRCLAGEGSTGIIYRSTDWGATWQQAENTAATKIWSLEHVGNGVCLAGSGNGGIIYQSSDISSPSTNFETITIRSRTATPTGTIRTFTLWGDGNTGKLRCYDGSTWQNLW